MTAALLACDWGTTNLRAWTLDARGGVVERRDFALGVSRLERGEAARLFESEVRPALSAERLPAMLCGMIGSDLGWTAVPYVDCPADARALAAAAVRPPGESAAPVWIAPGVRGPSAVDGVDVMRGEETQLIGWLAGGADRRRGRRYLCHPGTHAKWMQVEDGRLTRFATAMTGELFALLSRYGVLRTEAQADDPEAFEEGLAAAGDGGALAARLFGARARLVGGGKPVETSASYLSGLLIGAEVAALPPLLGMAAGEPLALLGDADLCRRYGHALRRRGLTVETFDGEASAVAGLFDLYSRMPDP